MVRTRKERKAANEIKLAQPDRSAAPSENTLLKLAQDRNLFEEAEKQKRKNAKSDDQDEDEDEPQYELCTRCNEEFDPDNDDESCLYHSGTLINVRES